MFIKWRLSNRIAYIFFKEIFGGIGKRTPLSKYMYFGVVISNILLFDLDRHSHSPFVKLVTFKPNVAIFCVLYHLEPISYFKINLC